MIGPLALVSLACGAGASTKVLDRPGFTMEVIDGTVERDDDRGTEGDHDVSRGLTTQAVSWSAIDATLDEDVRLLWDTMSALAASEGLAMLSEQPLEEGQVDGQRSLSFQVSMDGVTLCATTFDCPDTGLRMTLNTSGLVGAQQAHDRSLASARCKHEPVATVYRPDPFRFLGDEATWSLDDSDPTSPLWLRADGQVAVSVADQDDLDDGKAGHPLCATMLELAADRMTSMRIEARSPSTTPGGCRLDLSGVDVDSGEVQRARLEVDTCGGGRGWLSTCFSASDEELQAACAGLVACVDGAVP